MTDHVYIPSRLIDQLEKRKGCEAPITENESLAREAAELADSKKAADIVVLDMREVCTFTDYFVICTGRSSRQTQAICDEVRFGLKQSGTTPLRVEGEEGGDWILLDYLGVVVHVFTPEARDFYRLEVLWKEAPRVEVDRV